MNPFESNLSALEIRGYYENILIKVLNESNLKSVGKHQYPSKGQHMDQVWIWAGSGGISILACMLGLVLIIV